MGQANSCLKGIGSKEQRGNREPIKLATCEIICFADSDSKTPVAELLKSSIGLSGTILSESDIVGLPFTMLLRNIQPNAKGK